MAVDRSDHGLAQGGEVGVCALEIGRNLLVGVSRGLMPQRLGGLRNGSALRDAGEQRHVGPRAKSFACASQDDDARFIVTVGGLHGVADFLPHPRRPGIQFVRTVKRDGGNPLRHVIEDLEVVHR